jgi:hypothetical protein
MKVKTEVVQDRHDKDRVMLTVTEEINPQRTDQMTLRIPKTKIATLIKQLKAWK